MIRATRVILKGLPRDLGAQLVLFMMAVCLSPWQIPSPRQEELHCGNWFDLTAGCCNNRDTYLHPNPQYFLLFLK